MVKSHAKTAVFSLTAKSPNIHAKPSKGRSISESTTSFLQCVGMVYYCSIVCAPLQCYYDFSGAYVKLHLLCYNDSRKKLFMCFCCNSCQNLCFVDVDRDSYKKKCVDLK